MIPGIDPKMMKQAMKRLGMKQEVIEAEKVIIKCKGKDLVFLNPEVSKINAMGQETFQIIGDYSEENSELFSEDDIKTVMEQTGCTEEEARSSLKKEGDLAKAIIKLKKD